MKIQPIFPVGAMLLIFAAVFGLTAYIIIRNRIKTTQKIFSLGRMTLIYLLVLIIGLRPVSVETKYEFSTKNLDVLFVIDSTISMWALDYNGKGARMNGVKQDVTEIMNQLAGSNFGLVTFDNSSHVLSPFTQDMKYIADMVDILATPDSASASGTNMAVPYMDIDGLLQSSDKKENRKTIVFYISDGEITNNGSSYSYSELAKYIDSGAVLGYGTSEGGKMREGHSYIYDYAAGTDAISRIDEENLKKIADDLGVQYLNMNSGNEPLEGLLEIIREQSTTIVEQGDGTEKYSDTYYIFAVMLAAMLLVEAVMFIRKGRL